jgi:hypothetical protein
VSSTIDGLANGDSKKGWSTGPDVMISKRCENPPGRDLEEEHVVDVACTATDFSKVGEGSPTVCGPGDAQDAHVTLVAGETGKNRFIGESGQARICAVVVSAKSALIIANSSITWNQCLGLGLRIHHAV